jgi:hypothetical protein
LTIESTSTAQDQPAALPSSSSCGEQTPARPNRVLGKPLTAKQQTIYDLSRPVSEGGQGKKRHEVAAIMGISVPVVSKTLHAVYRKLGFQKRPGYQPRPGIEMREPEVAAAAIEAAADPWARSMNQAIEKANEQLKLAGLPEKVNVALVKRLRVKYANAVYAAKDLRTKEILEMLGRKIDLAAFYLDDKVMAEAPARDIMLGMTALIEKRNLLRGEPTQIISDHERAKIHELVPKLLEEARRRGLTVDGTVTEKVVEPLGNTA